MLQIVLAGGRTAWVRKENEHVWCVFTAHNGDNYIGSARTLSEARDLARAYYNAVLEDCDGR
jgi:hypothetical protein